MILGLFIAFLCLLAYYRRRGIRNQQAVEDRFWNREVEANHTRRKDISGLPYISIPVDDFSMNIYQNPELKKYEDILMDLSTKKILNLGNQTNTDLKLQYGPANLDILDQCDQNFATLCRTLPEYAKILDQLGHRPEAITVLEFGVNCGSDHSGNYRMLADFYEESNNQEKLQTLLHHANSLDSIMKQSIVSYIEEKIIVTV